MVQRFIRFLGKEISGLHEAAYLLGAFAILSQILALVRDRLLAHSFGAGITLDLYYAAFRIPDFLFAVIASLFSASILIPFLSEKIKGTAAGEVNVQSGREFLSAVFSVFLLLMISVSVVMFFLVPYLVPYLFRSFAEDPLRSQIILMTRILLLSPIFLGLSSLFASVTQLYNRFFIYGISPILYNVGIIIGVIFLAPRFGPAGLVMGVALGALFHFLVQVPFVFKQRLMPKLVFSFKKYKEITAVMLVAFPRTLAISAQEVSEFFLISLASLMSVGSISVLSLAYNLQSVPLSIIGVSYSLAAFPKLSNLFVTGEKEKFVQLVRTTARYIIFFSMPLIALFVVLRAYIVRVVLGSGAFNWQDTRLTAAALALFVVSLAAQGLILIFTRARYASGNTRTAFYINIASVGVTMCAAVLLTHFSATFSQFQFFIASLFRVEGILDTTVLMLPLAFSVGSIFGAITHVWTFDRDLDRGGMARNLVAMVGKLALVAVAMGFAAYIALNMLSLVFSLDTFMGVFAQGLIAGVCGVITGIMLLVLLRSPELVEVFGVLRRRIWNTPVIGPDPQNL